MDGIHLTILFSLQHTATAHCNHTLQHIARGVPSISQLLSRCSTLQNAATTHCNILQPTPTAHCNNTLQHTTRWMPFIWQLLSSYNTLQHTARTPCNTLSHTATHCNNTLQHTPRWMPFMARRALAFYFHVRIRCTMQIPKRRNSQIEICALFPSLQNKCGCAVATSDKFCGNRVFKLYNFQGHCLTTASISGISATSLAMGWLRLVGSLKL